MSCFYNERILCPECPVFSGKRPGELVGSQLILVDDNYLGTGVDIGYCKKCKKEFWITYKVADIREIGT